MSAIIHKQSINGSTYVSPGPREATPTVESNLFGEYRPLIQGNNQSIKHVVVETLQTSSLFGLRGLLIAMHYAANGFMMASFGNSQSEAANLACTIQGVSIGVMSGFVTAAGMEVAKQIKSYATDEEIGQLIKTSWIVVIVCSIFSIAVTYINILMLPLVANQQTAGYASDFLTYFAISILPDLMLTNNGQIIFQLENNKFINLIFTILFRAPSVFLSYYLAINKTMGLKGVGLGMGLCGLISMAIGQLWFTKDLYRKYSLTSKIDYQYFMKYVVLLFSVGWKLALQRASEWVSLLILVQTMSASSGGKPWVLESHPTVLFINLCALSSQGFGISSMMTVSRDVASRNELLSRYAVNNNDIQSKLQLDYLHKRHKNNLYITSVCAVIFHSILSLVVYLSEDKIIDLYITPTSNQTAFNDAKDLLYVNYASGAFDALRVVSAAVLRGGGDLVAPTLVSICMMAVTANLSAFLYNLVASKTATTFFISRAIFICICTCFNCYRFMFQDIASLG